MRPWLLRTLALIGGKSILQGVHEVHGNVVSKCLFLVP